MSYRNLPVKFYRKGKATVRSSLKADFHPSQIVSDVPRADLHLSGKINSDDSRVLNSEVHQLAA
ncbi:hypothetical protein BN1200_370031 [Klebsiella variicola]|nr:hypothetical protein BN1200_370031 [Klebsiella variicola]